jgi:hypothetical protein
MGHAGQEANNRAQERGKIGPRLSTVAGRHSGEDEPCDPRPVSDLHICTPAPGLDIAAD